jgi:tRNA pseudouridine13 synthase
MRDADHPGDPAGAGGPSFAARAAAPCYITSDVPPVGGRLKERPEDFLVEELPLYQPSGQGEHLYLFIEKRGMATMSMVGQVARHFGVRIGDVGYAGLKDKHAVTRQMVSVPLGGRREDQFGALAHPRMTVLWTARHGNKLRRGHLAGNRFVVRIRGVDPSLAVRAHRVLRRLERDGAPNRLGEQRFGALGNNHEVGRAVLLGEWRRALDLMLGPSDRSPASCAEARAWYARGDYARARAAFPARFHTERRALAALEKGTGPKRAVAAIGHMQRRYYLTAFQSAVFNAVLDGRLRDGALSSLRAGDLAWKHENGAVFAVGAAEAAAPEMRDRLARLEISPSGPMWGPGMTRAAGDVDRTEVAALEATGVTLERLAAYGASAGGRGDLEGARRPLRVPLRYADVEGGIDEHGPYIRCAFELPRGAFATAVMQEVMKAAVGAAMGADDEVSEGE